LCWLLVDSAHHTPQIERRESGVYGITLKSPRKQTFQQPARRLWTLVAVIEPRFKDLQIEHIGYVADLDGQLRPLRVPSVAQDSPPGVITVKKGEMAVVPLRIELRSEDGSPGNASSADNIYKRIKNATRSSIQFRVKDNPGTQKALRTIFSKSIEAFRPPEVRKINRTYIFGPAYELKTITITGKTIPLRSAPAVAVAFYGEAERLRRLEAIIFHSVSIKPPRRMEHRLARPAIKLLVLRGGVSASRA
jgi:hypothetical protein